MQRYIALVQSETDCGFRLSFPDLPELWCSGPDLDRLVAVAEPVLAGYLEELKEDGRPVPQPSTIEDLHRLGCIPAATIVKVVCPDDRARGDAARRVSGAGGANGPSRPESHAAPARWRLPGNRQAG